MKCEACNSTIIVADRQCENCGTSIFDIAIKWQARAEKAEAELEAIKARIEAVTEETIWNLIEKHGLGTKETCVPCVHEYAKETVNLIKQIGGVK